MAKDQKAAADNAPSAQSADLVQQQIASLKAQLAVLEGALPEHVPAWRRHYVRATGRGVANNRIYDAGEEFYLVLDGAARPASWYDVLDEGEPAKPENRNALDFAKAAPAPGAPESGYAKGVSPVL